MVRRLALGLCIALGCGDDVSDDTGASTTTTVGTSSSGGSSAGSSTTLMTSITASASGSAGTETRGETCAELNEVDCLATAACDAVFGRQFEDMPGAWCFGGREYFGCTDMGCDDAISVACDGDMPPTYEFPTTCIPDGWAACDLPTMDPVMPCP